jgi:hypothetical protein
VLAVEIRGHALCSAFGQERPTKFAGYAETAVRVRRQGKMVAARPAAVLWDGRWRAEQLIQR